MSMTYEPHELALILPPLKPEQFEHLKQSIATEGLSHAIILYEDKILDGVHRERACDELGLEPFYEEYDGDDPARFVFGHNLGRRHLTTSQRGMIGARLEEHFSAPRGRPKKNSRRSAGITKPRRRNEAAERAAEIVGTSARSISRAKRVIKLRPDLAEKVKSGELAVNAADEEIRTGKRTGNAPEPEPKHTGKIKNFNGKSNAKRMGEIKEERKRTGKYTDLLKLQLEMTKLCVVLEDYEPDDFGLDTTTADLIADFYDDLVSLGEWWERSVRSTTAWLSDLKLDATIAKLRKKTLANGCSEGEVENAQSIIAKLERAREALLEAGDQV
jgi:hypothetical protein